MKKDECAIVTLSGGQDSTTCLAWAKNRYAEVECITFLYNQKHQIEIEQAKKITKIFNVPIHIVSLTSYAQLVNSALTDHGDVNAAHPDNSDLPASYVPNRNALFLTLAHAYAQKRKARAIVAGMNQADYSGYPDCRRPFIDELENVLALGSAQAIPILTPVMDLSKAETFRLAETEGALPIVLMHSHTCYNGTPTMNDWGRGCGECNACRIRIKGYYEYKERYG